MWTKNGLLTTVVLLITLLHSTTAIVCGDGTTDLYVSSQEELDFDLNGCTSWIGGIVIGYKWNGPLVLNNITNITKYFETETYYQNSSQSVGTQFLTSVDAPELRDLKFLTITRSSNLTRISLPKLERVHRVLLDHMENNALTLDFSSLARVGSYVDIAGNIPRVSFPSLVEVKGELSVASDEDLVGAKTYERGADFPGIDVDFPVLEKAALLHLVGNISSINMPSLRTLSLTYGDDYHILHEWDLKIWTAGNSLEVTLPLLSEISDISLKGNVGSFSFPALKTIKGSFDFEPSDRATFDVRPLQDAWNIDISGNLTSYNLDSLTSLDILTIQPDSFISCNPALEAWRRLRPQYDEEDWNDGTRYRYSGFSCNGFEVPEKKQEKEKKPFPKIPVGLTIGIGVPVFIFFAFALWHSNKAKRKAEEIAKIPPPDYEAEMAARSAGGGEVLPDYEPRRSGGSVIELVDMTRPSQLPHHPPGYDIAVGSGTEAGPSTGGSGEVPAGETVVENAPRPGAGTA
ncbi:hypothetical protein ACEPPN_000620 [Leptodophora sp. 'Broadleaf-Isolate-01']